MRGRLFFDPLKAGFGNTTRPAVVPGTRFLEPTVTTSIQGRLSFTLRTAYTSVGRSTIQPLIDRGTGNSTQMDRRHSRPSSEHVESHELDLLKRRPIEGPRTCVRADIEVGVPGPRFTTVMKRVFSRIQDQ